MNAADLIRRLRAAGATLSADGERLRVDAPRGSLSAELIEEVRASKAELLRALARQAGTAGTDAPDGPVTLAPAQERIWLFQQMEPDAATYNVTLIVRFTGPLDTERLAAAMDETVRRHEALRTVYQLVDGVVHARTLEPPRGILRRHGHAVPEADRATMEEVVATETARPFRLDSDVSIRALLVQRDEDTHDLIYTAHHLAMDGMSVGIFARDLVTLYMGGALPPLRARYADFAEAENRRWSGALLHRELKFWQEYLDGAPKLLEVPTDRPRVSQLRFTGGVVSRHVEPGLAHELLGIAGASGGSLFMVMLAAYAAALHNHSGQRDIVIGSPSSGRPHADFGDVVGMFVNQLPLRMRVERGATFRQLVDEARRTTLRALEHEGIPFGRLVDEFDRDRDAGRPPIFQAAINLMPGGSGSPVEVGDLTVSPPDVDQLLRLFESQAKLDYTLYIVRLEGALELILAYNAELFEQSRMDALLDDVIRVIEGGVADPDGMVEHALAPARRSLPVDASLEWPLPWPELSVAARFEDVAGRYADHAAVVGAARDFSYREVLADSHRIARLVDAKLPPAGRAGVLLPHDHRMPAALLGVLRAGRAYVPLDARYPADRLALIASDAELDAIITIPGLVPLCREACGDVPILDANEAAAGDAPLPPLPASDVVAYLLHTSGSTGRPKAVVQTQGNLVHQAARYAGALGLTPADRLTLVASISFDAALMDLFGALLSGAAIAPVDLRETSVAELPDVMQQRRLTVLHTTPAVFRAMLGAAQHARFPTIRAVDLGGERVRADDVAAFDQRFEPDAVLVNSYGPSEHTFALGHIVDRRSRSIEVPIGAPLADVEVTLLAADGGEDAVSGEMVLSSRYGALGYWRQPELTARAFGVDARRPGCRTYRTGDVVRRRPDGTYVYLHRADDQLKVRGYRVEPQEVEAVLAACPGIAAAAVHGVTSDTGETVLTACIVEGAGAPSRADLIEWCGRTLPPFMVPTAWVTLDRLPLTPSGKVDRRALPAAATADQPQAAAFASQEEELLAEIWDSLLHGGRPSADANFFEAGGHSLAAMQFVARVRDSFGVDLPLRRFFDTPTIRATAEWIRGDRTSGVSVPPLARSEHGESAPLSFAQERLWFMQQLDLESTAYNVSSAAIVAGDIDAERVRRAVHTVCMRQDALRTRFITMHGTPRQVVDDEPAFDFVAADATVAGSPVEHARDLIAGRLNAAYDLQRGPLLRICLVRVAEGRWALGVGMHHIVSDVWSLGVFARDLFAAYAADDGRVVPTQVNCRDHAAWQRGWLQGDALEQQVGYWRDQLRDAAPLELPLDFPRPPVFTFRGAALDMELAPGLRERVRDVAVQQGATPFMVLLAAFNALLHAWSRQDDLAVGVPIAGRGAPATQELVGVFINTLVHRNDVSGDPSFRELLGRVRSTALDAYAHEDAPFEVVVRELKLVPDPSRAPLFQALFNVVGADTGNITGEGFAMERLPLPAGGAQFDLTLNIAWTEHQPSATLRYCTSLFTEETARRLLEHYFVILDRALEDPAQPLSALAVASAADTALVHALNAGDSGTDGTDATLLSLFQARATATPERVAVESASGSYTYGELLHEAQQVAAALTRLGVMPGDRVGVLLDRGREMVAALLGILGAGAAYVPLDPNYPGGRIRYMLDDARVAALVSHRGLYREYADLLPVLDLDAPPRSLARQFMLPEPQDTAYVIYTSGSTGRPKGVEVLHGNVANFLLSMQREPGIRADDRLLAVTTISFDIAVLELFLPLVSGACVVIAETGQTLDGGRLADIIADRGITLMQATPATWKLLLAAGWMGSPALRVLCGGEALAPGLAADLLPRVAELWNMYGPTETTVWSTLARIEDGDAITIGRPIARTSVWILTGAGGIAPVGVPGELCIGGAGVAAGYFGQPDLTAERFVANPFGGGRIYRTGDLARLRTDGRLEHLGRLDSQVKVRGFRIEAGEVEAALRELPGVTDAAVIARDDRLIAYVTGDAAPGAAELRRSLAERLPPYMLPSAFVALAALPLTQNGKVDRRRLPDAAPPVAAPAHVPADVKLSPAESMLVDVWSSLLDVDDIRADDNFFELGGHSLLAMQVVAQVEERTGHRLEPRSLFFRSLAELAATIPAPEPVQ